MKNIVNKVSLLLLSSAFMLSNAYAQLKVDNKDLYIEYRYNKIDSFRMVPNRVIQREYLKMGEINNLIVYVVHHTDLKTQQKISAVKFEYNNPRSYGNYCIAIYLDQDEFECALLTVDALLETKFNTRPDYYEDVICNNQRRFNIGAHYSENIWEGFISINRNYKYFKNVEFIKLRDILVKAKQHF